MAEPAQSPPVAPEGFPKADQDDSGLNSHLVSVDTIKEQLATRRDSLKRQLDSARHRRDLLNDMIRGLVTEYDEAERVVRALEPKPRKKAT